jgi:hypothetical protein
MRALEAGAHGGEGDNRCTAQGIPSDSGFIEVDGLLRISVRGTAPESAVVALRTDFDRWRQAHPCPMVQVEMAAGRGRSGSCSVGRGRPGGPWLVLAFAAAVIAVRRATRTGSLQYFTRRVQSPRSDQK